MDEPVEEVKAVAVTTDVRIHGAVQPQVAIVFGLVNQACDLLKNIPEDAVDEMDRYCIRNELPSYFRTLQDKLSGIVLRSGRAS